MAAENVSIGASAAIDAAVDAVSDFLGELIDHFVPARALSAAREKSAPITTLPPVASQATTTIIYQTITQPVIERVVESGTVLGALTDTDAVTRVELDAALNAVRSQFGLLSASIGANTFVSTPTFAHSQRIDQLANITLNGVSGLTDDDIPDGITASNYLLLTGGTLSGDFAVTGNFTVAGTQTLSGAITIPYLTATSSTASMFTGGLLALASTTIGDGTQAGGLTISGGATTTGSLNIGNGSVSGGLIMTGVTMLATAGNATNIFVGHAGQSVIGTAGYYNTVVGLRAGNVIDTAHDNTVVGKEAGLALATGAYNTFLGNYAGRYITGGSNNVIVGSTAGDNLTAGSFNVMIGSGIQAASSTGSSQLNIGNLIFGTGLTSGSTVSSGNVGIGTTTPWGKLSVTNTGSGPSFVVEDSTSPDSTPFIVDASGNVGIGTTSPAYALDVVGTGQFYSSGDGRGVNIRGRASADNAGFLIFKQNNGNDNAGIGSVSGDLRLYTGGSTLAEQMRITSSGSVGIGTTNPSEKLTVDGGANTTSIKLVGQNRAAFFGQDPTGLSIYQTGAAPIFFLTDGLERLRIDGSGNVGIGTTNPNEGKVEVKGGTVCVDTNSDDTASSCIASESDARLKQNIQTLDASASLDTLLKLNPVSFDWRATDPEVLKHYPVIARFASSTHSVGLIAQEVQPLFPLAIEQETVGDSEVQYFQLDYTKFVPLIISSIKELYAKVLDVKNTVVGYAQSFTTRRLCVEDVCVTRDQFQAMVSNAAILSPATGGQASPPPAEDTNEPEPELLDIDAPSIVLDQDDDEDAPIGDPAPGAATVGDELLPAE